MSLADGVVEKSEILLYLEASRLAEVIRAAAHEIVVLVDALDASNLRNELSEPLALVEKARAECSEPAARQLASLLVLGARHKSAPCKNVTPGSGCRFGVHCCFMHGEHDRRRDPMQYPTRLLMCPNAKGGCPRGDACELLHTTTEFETHPITLLRQLRSNSATSSNSFGGARLLAACPFAAQLGIKQLSEDGSVVIGGAVGTQDARMKACRLVINAKPRPCPLIPSSLRRVAAVRPTATLQVAPTASAQPLEPPPASESEHTSWFFNAHRTYSPAGPDGVCDAAGSRGGDAPASGDDVPAEPDGPDPNDVAAEMHADIQRELARRLCSHIQHLIRARIANPLSSAIRVGPAGEHLVPVSAVTASFVEEQRGVVTSLTHFARGLGYTKLTSFLAGPHLKKCLELVHDRVQNQTYIASLLYQNRTCRCDQECRAKAAGPLVHGKQQQVFPEHILRSTVRQVESLGSQLVRDRAVKKTPTPPPLAMSLLCGGPASPHAMPSPKTVPSTKTVPSMIAVPSPNQIPHGQTTPPAPLMNVDLSQALSPEPFNTELYLSARISLLQSLAGVALFQPASLASPSPPGSRTSPTASYEWPCSPRMWRTASLDDIIVNHSFDFEENETQLPRLPHCLLSD